MVQYKRYKIGLSVIITALFVLLKLTHVINWGWFYVFWALWLKVLFISGVVILAKYQIWKEKKVKA